MMDNLRFYLIEYADGEYSIQSMQNGGGYMLDLPRTLTREEALLCTIAANATLEAIALLKRD